MAAILATTAVAAVAMPSAAVAQQQTSYDIPAGPLAGALTRLAEEGGIRLVYDSALADGRTSGGAKDARSVAQALSLVLEGTGLVARMTGAGAYTIEPAPQGGRATITLGTVRVQGTVDGGDALTQSLTSDPAATEGTGSYAARAISIFKTPQSLKETPVSVSVITRQRLEDQNIFSLKDALVLAPGLSLDQTGEDASFYSRGYNLNTQVDGVTLSSSSRGNRFDTAIYDRIEVLRGPIGILKGVGSIGGTINLVRKRPTRDFAVNGDLSYGSWNNFHGSADIGGPLDASGSIRARAVAAYEDSDFFYDVVNNKRLTAYGVAEFDVGSNTMLGVTAAHTKMNRNGQYYGIPEALTWSVPRSTYPGTKWTGADARTFELGADLTQDFGGGWKGVLRFVRRETKYDYAYLIPLGSPETPEDFVPFLAYRMQGKDINNGIDASISGPLRLFGGDHFLTFGANYDQYRGRGASPMTIAFGTAIAPDIEKPEIDPADDFSTDKMAQWAPYAQGRFDLVQDVTLTLGGRLSQYHNRTRASDDVAYIDWGKQNGRITPYAGLTWDITPTLTLYGSYADIFNPSTYKAFDGSILPPVVGWQGEAGIKGSFFHDQLNASLSYYRIRETNRVMKDPDPTHVGCTYAGSDCYVATGLILSQGIDAEVSGSPITGLQIQASYTYNLNKYLADTYSQVGDIYVSSSPKHQFKLWADYQFGQMRRQDVGRWSIGGGMIAQSEISFGSDNPYGQGAYAIFNGQIGYRPTENLRLTLTVNNIFDRTYLESVGAYNFYGEPRNVMLSLRFGL